ncbi:hypothetical protein BUE76_00525 [Cnuella takakiae]|nr:hypothetical protein BUE76_00525 [Cnuella takakiae]
MIRLPAWWIRIFDFPRLQLFFLCLIALVLLLIYKGIKSWYGKLLVSLSAGALLYQLHLIIPFTPVYAIAAPDAKDTLNSFSILHANVEMSNRNAAGFIALVKKYLPDILSVNEPDDWWQQQLEPLDSLYPFRVKQPQSNTYGMLLLSRLPLQNSRVNYLVEEKVPSIFTKVTVPGGRKVNLYCIHPRPPRPGQSVTNRNQEILILGSKIKEDKSPALVVGDLNDVAWSYTTRRFKEYSGVLDPRQGRGFFNTYNAQWPLLRYPLDYIFYTPDFGLLELKKLDYFGSDHFPMFIRMTFTGN